MPVPDWIYFFKLIKKHIFILEICFLTSAIESKEAESRILKIFVVAYNNNIIAKKQNTVT